MYKKYYLRAQVISQKQRPISSIAFLILTESEINPGFENQVGESSSEGNARKIVEALNSKARLEDRVSKLEILIRGAISEFEIGGKPSTALGRAVQDWRDEAIALLDKFDKVTIYLTHMLTVFSFSVSSSAWVSRFLLEAL